MEKILSQIEKYVLFAVIFLVPISVINISSNPFVVSKLAILVFGVFVLLFIRALRITYSGKMDFSVGSFDFPVFLFAVSILLSAVLRTPNKMEAYLLPGTATSILFGVLLYYLINQLKKDDKDMVSMVLVATGSVFSLLTLLAFSGLFTKIPQLPAYMKSNLFTPEGGHLPSAIFLATLLPISIGHVLSNNKPSLKAFYISASVIIVLTLAISIYSIFPGRPTSPRFPSYSLSWSVAVDALKESPIFGVGPGNYLTAFNRFRPLSYNLTDLWAVKYATARSFYLTALTEGGMLTLAGLILLLWTIYKYAKKDLKEKSMVNWGFAATASLLSLIVLVVSMALFPATTLIIVLFFIVLSLNSKTRHTSLNLTTQEATPGISVETIQSRFPALLISLPIIILVIFGGYRSGRILFAEYKFKKSLDYLTQNDATKTFETMREAININPRVDRYHATFTRINLALANAIAQKAVSVEGQEAQQITDQDRSNITLLIQNAIAEGKATVALNPLRSGNWEVLAQTYRAIMPLAQGADAFAVQTYRQAVALDPINPNLRIALGGIYFAARDYENAIRIFELAAATKNDLPNTHYNLSFALREKGDLDRAIQEMTLVLSLIPDKASQDYDVARQALEDMQAKKKAEAPQGQELTPPQEGEQILEPPVELPEGSEPPEAPISPTPTVGASPTPSISPSPTESTAR